MLEIDIILFIFSAPASAAFIRVAASRRGTSAAPAWPAALFLIKPATTTPPLRRSTAGRGTARTTSAVTAAPRGAGGTGRLTGPLHRRIAPAIAAIRRTDPPGTEADIEFAVILISPDLKSYLYPLTGAETVQQGSLVLYKFHLDILGVFVVPRGYDKLTFGESAAKRHDVHDDLDGPFDFVSHCGNFRGGLANSRGCKIARPAADGNLLL